MSFLKKSGSSKKVTSNITSDASTETVSPRTTSEGAIVTGIPGWLQFVDPGTGRPFFINKKTKKRSWGLPLRDLLKDPKVKGPRGDDDWECHVDPKTFKRFYSSKQHKKLQWKVPHVYGYFLSERPFFSDSYVAECLKTRNNNVIKNTKGEATGSNMTKMIKLTDIIQNNITCAAFHRFLLASHAEENLLFFGAVELFNFGEWKGMKVLGVEMKKVQQKPGDKEFDEGKNMLQAQLAKSHASTRIGMLQKPKTLKEEAQIIYDKFLAENSELWVCHSQQQQTKILNEINDATDTTDLRGIFDDAQTEVYESMIDDLFPRFLKLAMDEDQLKSFETDEILRATVLELAGYGNDYLL